MAEYERINRVKEVLVIKGMSQKELAAAMGRNPNTIASICNNKTTTPPQRPKADRANS